MGGRVGASLCSRFARGCSGVGLRRQLPLMVLQICCRFALPNRGLTGHLASLSVLEKVISFNALRFIEAFCCACYREKKVKVSAARVIIFFCGTSDYKR